jgi:hypothetical protein
MSPVESASRRVQAIGGKRRKFLLNALQLLLDVWVSRHRH